MDRAPRDRKDGPSDWIYSQLLRVYPRAFRKEFGDEMCLAFKRLRLETRRQEGVGSVTILWTKAIWDILHSGIAERRRRSSPTQMSGLLGAIVEDVKYGFRALRKNPGFTIGSVVTLALGIGASTTVFCQVNGVLLRPLPYGNPERLLQLSETSPDITAMDLSYPDFWYWQQHTEVFESMAAFDDARFALAVDGRSERVEGAIVSTSVFSTLGISPILGRDFLHSDGSPTSDPVVIVGHSLWTDRLASDPTAVGQSLILNGRSHTIIGIAPPKFMFPERARLWVPIIQDPLRADPNEYDWDAVALLKDGISVEQAAIEATEIARQLARTYPDTKASLGAIVYPLRDADINADIRLTYLVLMASVIFVLLIACVNVANLVLARGTSRLREISLRRAVGASRGRIIGLLLAESVLLAVLGSALGVVLAVWANKAVVLSLPVEMPFWINFDLDLSALAFVVFLLFATTSVFGLLPAIETSETAESPLLRSVVQKKSLGSMRRRTTSAMLASEVALSFVLLIAGAMMMRGFLNLRTVSPGLNPEGVLAMGLHAPAWNFSRDDRLILYESILREVGGVPGVQSAAAVAELPITGGENEIVFAVEEHPYNSAALPVANGNVVTPEYFLTMEIPLIRGRDFVREDRSDAVPVTIVSQSLAERYWPNENPIGKRIRMGTMWHRTPTLPEPAIWHTVVGVVGDVRHEDLAEAGRMGIYLPYGQLPASTMTIVVKTASEPLSISDEVRSRIWNAAPDIVVYDVLSMEQVLARSIWATRIFTAMLGSFATVALVLAAVGIYSVVAFSVARRTNEIGVRMAMGARRLDVLRLVLGQIARYMAVGLAIGVTGAVAVSRLLENLVYEVNAFDPEIYFGVATALLLVGITAGLLPARKAVRLDPTETLRSE